MNQIRLYSGEKYEVVQEIGAGAVCAVVGLSRTKPGRLGVDMGPGLRSWNQCCPTASSYLRAAMPVPCWPS